MTRNGWHESQRPLFSCAWVRRMAVGLLLMVGASGCCGGEPDRNENEVVDEVRAAWSTFCGALAAADLETAIDFYSDAPDFRWIEDGAVVYRSKEQVRAALGQLTEFGAVTFDFSEPTVLPLGDRHASLSVEVTTKIEPSGGRGFEFTVLQSILLRREPAGWRFLQGHSSSPKGDGPGG